MDRKIMKDKESMAAAFLILRTQKRSREVSLLKLSAQHSLHFGPKQEAHSLPACFRMSKGAIFLPPLPSRMPETNKAEEQNFHEEHLAQFPSGS